MNALHTILTIIQVILAVGLVVIVTIQSGTVSYTHLTLPTTVLV